MSEIVVGVDGAPGCAEAVSWAASEAALRGSILRVVCVTQSPTTWLGMGEALGGAVSATISESDLHDFGVATIDEVIALAEVSDGVEVSKEVLLGHPASVLVALSSDAELLVVGSGGHSDVGSVLLGSVAMHCVHHARCPVVVVPINPAR